MGEVIDPMTTETAKALDDYCLEEQLAAALRAGDRPEVELLRDEARRRFAGMMGLPTSLMADLAPCWRRPLAILEPARGPIRLLRTPGRRRRRRSWWTRPADLQRRCQPREQTETTPGLELVHSRRPRTSFPAFVCRIMDC
jgi:hypothetical protein